MPDSVVLVAGRGATLSMRGEGPGDSPPCDARRSSPGRSEESLARRCEASLARRGVVMVMSQPRRANPFSPNATILARR